jgi:diamine N-acetyltransferase
MPPSPDDAFPFMVEVQRASLEDAAVFAAMEQAEDTKEYILPYSQGEHLRMMSDPNIIYLRILKNGTLAGFFILALDTDARSVEFRRIVVSAKGRGVGQSAIARMEHYCRTEQGRSRIWLDVFEHNARGRHIYEKLGYEKYGETTHGDRRLLLYEKPL